MKDFEEKLLKRWLKRKVKITLATIVAFLISSSLSLAETLYIRDGENGVEFKIDNQNWGENPYSENSFENNIYTNNRKIESDYIGIYNKASDISLINENEIIVNAEKGWGIYNSGTIEVLKNSGLLEVNSDDQSVGISNYGINKGKILNQGTIKVTSSNGNVWGIDNGKNVEIIENDGLLEVNGTSDATGIGNYNAKVEDIINTGRIKINGNYVFGGIINNGETTNIINTGIIETIGQERTTGINNDIDGKAINIINSGKINLFSNEEEILDIIDNNGEVTNIINTGIMEGKGKNSITGIVANGEINNIENEGKIELINIGEKSNAIWGINIIRNVTESIKNKGVIYTESKNYNARGINTNNGDMKENIIIENTGLIFSKTDGDGVEASGITIYGTGIKDIYNKGIIKVSGEKAKTIAINISPYLLVEKVENNGILAGMGKGNVINIKKEDNFTNNGIVIGDTSNISDLSILQNNGMIFSIDNGKYEIEAIGNSNNVINAALTDEENKNTNNWTATGSKSIDLTEDKSDMIYNGITNTLKISGDRTLTNSIVNGYTSAIVFDENGGSLTLDNSIINGGVDEASATIKGSSIVDNLALTNGTIINGNIDLGAGDDKLSINNTVQLNSDLFGGDGSDSLTFNGKDENNINIFNKVGGFENINVATDVTLFESAEVTGADSITIQKDGNLILRIDSTNGNSHALSGNTGTISSNGGKLLLALNGVGEGETISFGDTTLDESMKGNENGFKEATVDTTSLLHNIEKIDDKTVKVSTEDNIPYVNDVNYNELNTIYQSIRSIDGVKEFNVTDDKALVEFTNYLHDIYAGNPYSFSSELSRKSVNMFSDVVMGRDLYPEVNKWAIYGGLTHIDGGTKDTYFGKGYYTYDIGSKDIDVDSKITGMYVQGEYGVNETLNLGIIFGGNQSESEINNSSKVEGDSFYLGAYAKKYLGNLRLLAGIGYQYGDYEVDRVAVGYDGITTTRTFDSNYNDNTFNIYAQAKYSNKLAENLYLEPSVALDYAYVNQEGASENGVLAIETDSKDFNYTTAKFGVDLRKDIPTTTATHSLVAGAYYNRMLDGYEEENITGRFVGGSDFDILVSPSNKHEVGLRAKYEVSLNNGVTFDVKGSYTFEREGYSGENKNEHKGEWIVGVGIGYRF